MEEEIKKESLNIPEWLRLGKDRQKSPVYFIDIRGKNLDIKNPNVQKELNQKLKEIFYRLELKNLKGPAVIKVHPGEPKNVTYLLPELVQADISFMKEMGIDCVIGDTTVIYRGARGGDNNPLNNVSAYMNVIEHNRWSQKYTGVPFVILDRPITSVPGVLEFSDEEILHYVDSPGYYKYVHIASGIEKAGLIFNNAHLTMHGLSPVALCVKGLSMGGGGRKGKLQMHANLVVRINEKLCSRCGTCAKNCPGQALKHDKEKIPVLIEEKCMGCGECLALCPEKAIEMVYRGAIKWGKGTDTFPRRMADFLISMMNGKWDGLVNVGHLYTVTAECDCMNAPQKPIFSDIGLAVSRNPFALDMLASRLFEEQVKKEKVNYSLGNYASMFDSVRKDYGIIVEPDVVAV